MTEEKQKSKLIDCPHCESKVLAKVVAQSQYYFSDWMETPEYIFLLECPGCGSPVVGHAGMTQVDLNDYEIDPLSRVWPSPTKVAAWQIPESARVSMDEAARCFDARAYNACVVMCGRALEAICKDHGVTMKSLMSGLKELKQKGVIDGRLYEWGDALRQARNIGAHASESETSREDARDVLEFTHAIGEYVYVLADKYEGFMQRKAKRAEKLKANQAK